MKGSRGKKLLAAAGVLGLGLFLGGCGGGGSSAASPTSNPPPPPSASAICVGTPITQNQTNVTSQLTSVGPGVTVEQLTDNAAGDFLTYVGIPHHSAVTDTIVYNGDLGIVSALPDGTSPQLISSSALGKMQMSWDGRIVVFSGLGTTAGTVDVYGVFLAHSDSHNASGNCATIRLTNLNMSLNPASPTLKLSPPAVRSDGKNVIAFAAQNFIQRALEDGTLLDPQGFDPPDLYHTADYHRVRLNPKFPQWVLYSRDQVGSNGGTPELWLFNFDTQQLCSVGPIGTSLNHDAWSPDGTKIAAQNPNQAHALLITVFNSDGSFPAGVSCSGGAYSGAQVVDISAGVGQPANFCDFPPDGSPILTCSSGMAGVVNPATGQSVPESVYLLAQDGSAYKYLAATDAQALSDPGIPLSVFTGDSTHILFRSDRTGTPQVYLITGFTPTVP